MKEQIQYAPAVCQQPVYPSAIVREQPALSADEELKRGIIHTQVSPGLARAICAVFVCAICAVPLSQAILELVHGQRPQVLDVFLHAPSKNNFNRFEEELTRSSLVRQFVQPRVQSIESAWGFGNSKAIVGRDGWLFYEPGISYIGGPGILDDRRLRPPRGKLTENDTRDEQHPDPRAAILQFDRQCRDAGVHLILLPIPDKAMIQTAQVSARFEPSPTMLNNPDYARLVSELRDEGVDIFDAAPPAAAHGAAPFLTCDTHWTPEWMQSVVTDLAAYISRSGIELPKESATSLHEVTAEVTGTGDLVQMLKLPADQSIFKAQTVTVRRVLDSRGQPWTPSRAAPVLVLGDSFNNIYSLESMAWGDSGGFVEHLSLALSQPIDRMTRNDCGAHATREMLSRELAKGRNRLEGKKVVVWEFAIRELTAGDWKLLDMRLSPARPHKFFVPPAQTTITATGTVADAARAPRPGTVPYKDHIIAIHLVDLKISKEGTEDGEAIVYMWSMRNNTLTGASKYREGDKVSLRLQPWSEIEKKLGSINRADLTNDELLLEEPCWGEEATP